jgi:Nitroreductase
MHTPPALQLLDARRSVPSLELGEPGPDDATLLRMLQSAVRVPDHGKLVPFRFLRIAGDARHALGEFLAARPCSAIPTRRRRWSPRTAAASRTRR